MGTLLSMPSTADIKQRDPQNLTVPSSSQNLRNEYLSQSDIKRDLEIDNKIRDTILGNENRYSQAISMFPALNYSTPCNGGNQS